MFELRQTETFRKWWKGLPDERARALVLIRLERLGNGHMGDVKPVGGGISELRIHYGPGYRVYFIRRGATLVLLLSGGNKGTQTRDIRQAQRLAETWSASHGGEVEQV